MSLEQCELFLLLQKKKGSYSLKLFLKYTHIIIIWKYNVNKSSCKTAVVLFFKKLQNPNIHFFAVVDNMFIKVETILQQEKNGSIKASALWNLVAGFKGYFRAFLTCINACVDSSSFLLPNVNKFSPQSKKELII